MNAEAKFARHSGNPGQLSTGRGHLLSFCRGYPYFADNSPYIADDKPYFTDDKPYIADDSPYITDTASPQPFGIAEEKGCFCA